LLKIHPRKRLIHMADDGFHPNKEIIHLTENLIHLKDLIGYMKDLVFDLKDEIFQMDGRFFEIKNVFIQKEKGIFLTYARGRGYGRDIYSMKSLTCYEIVRWVWGNGQFPLISRCKLL
jgi:HJR/Mrr/RecB family endonuclease